MGSHGNFVTDPQPFLQLYRLAYSSRFPDYWPISGMEHWQGSYGTLDRTVTIMYRTTDELSGHFSLSAAGRSHPSMKSS